MTKPVTPSLNQHLFGRGPKRILAIDGGGVRGSLATAFLERLETLITEREGRPVRLCDWFDLIGGTSTGAIVAAALAIGYSAREIAAFYHDLAPRVFKAPRFRLPGWHATFDARTLHEELKRFLPGLLLGSDEVRTGFGVVLKRLDTGSAWILMNNPRSAFWETPTDGSFIGNRHYPLADIVRASAAAPFYFDPQTIEISTGCKPGLFLDGALTPHNNPSLALTLAAVLPPYGLNWPTGEDTLLVVSIGTGTFSETLTAHESRRTSAIGLAVKALAAQISDSQELILTLMAWLGRCSLPWPINAEIGDLAGVAPPCGNLFRYHRCDIQLEREWLATNVGAHLSDKELKVLRQIGNPANVETLYQFGRIAAQKQLTPDIIQDW